MNTRLSPDFSLVILYLSYVGALAASLAFLWIGWGGRSTPNSGPLDPSFSLGAAWLIGLCAIAAFLYARRQIGRAATGQLRPWQLGIAGVLAWAITIIYLFYGFMFTIALPRHF